MLLDRGKSRLSALRPKRHPLIVTDIALGLGQGAKKIAIRVLVEEPIGRVAVAEGRHPALVDDLNGTGLVRPWA